MPQHMPENSSTNAAEEDEWEIVGYCDTTDGCDSPHPIRRRKVVRKKRTR